jgi:outer membrane protein OmpA-like peptidoglycan-associated protein/tetratricopeptide (TPR) repeat protein
MIMKTILSIRFFLSLIIVVAFCLHAKSQVDQRIALADKYYDAGEYFTAAGLYEQFLNPPKKQQTSKANFPLNTRRYGQGSGGVDKYDIIFKQAESYRLANYWQEAAAKYKECFEKDLTKYADAFYWYAICQRSLGKYAAAEEYLQRFLKTAAANDNRKEEAEKELQRIQFIKKELARADSGLFKIKKNNTAFSKEKGIFAMNGIGGGQYIFTSTVNEQVNVNANPNHSRLFYATINEGVLENMQPVVINDLDASLNQGAACMSADKNILYLTQWTRSNGKNISSLYYSTRQGDGWSKPVLIPLINKDGFSSKQPFCSADGKTLYFSSDIPGGNGGFDIWYAEINADGTIGVPKNARSINTKGDEQAPFYHHSTSTLIFSSNGMQGMGGFDLFSVKMNESGFGKIENMGHPVNSSRDDIYFYAADQNELLKKAIIGSDRGSECCLETYTLNKSPKKQRITGVVKDCKSDEPINGAVVIMKDGDKTDNITTGLDGRFVFEFLNKMGQQTFNISKEGYNDKMAIAATESVDESDLLIDTYNNVTLCLEQIVKEEKKLVIKAENVVTVFFDFDKSILNDSEQKVLDSLYNILNENKTATLQISGYTDGMGSDAYNKKLSDRRAKACADYLRKKGIDMSRISFVSFGECCPVEMEIINGRDNPDGRSKNRRALINVSKDE